MSELRIGVYICWCGSNIASMVDVESVAKDLAQLPNVVVAKDYKYMCSDPGQDLIIKDIKEYNLNRIVVAACSPRIHELTFQKVLENAGLNAYLFEMANIREQCAWVHTRRVEATAKAKSLVVASVERVALHQSLDKREVEVNPNTLIIGAGIAGITAALEIGGSGKKVYLVEKEELIGGRLRKLDLTFPYLDPADMQLLPKVSQVKNNPNVDIFVNSKVEEISGYVGNFKAKIKQTNGEKLEVEIGNIIVATGLKEFDAERVSQYGYGKLANVITSLEFDKMVMSGKVTMKGGKEPKNIVFINCVGSRNSNYHEYCSRTCCSNTLKQANQIKSVLPNSNVLVAYTDMRTFCKGHEEFYERTARQGVIFLMFDKNNLPVVKKAVPKGDSEMFIEINEILSGKFLEVPADMVVLAVGMEAHKDSLAVGHLAGISRDKDGFFIEKHPKLDPVATTTDGVYIAGCCQGPKDIPDSVSQAAGAAARVLGSIAKGKVTVEAITSHVNEDICAGCQTCIVVCPYSAIDFDQEKNISHVNEVLCKGCGTCTSACPSGAISSKHFTREQILSQIEGMLSTIK